MPNLNQTFLTITCITFPVLFLTILAFFFYKLYDFSRILITLLFDHTRNKIIDEYAEKTVRIVEEGGLPNEFKPPANSKEKFQLACSILTDSLSNTGFDTRDLHIPAIVKAKVNQLYHDEIPRLQKQNNNTNLNK